MKKVVTTIFFIFSALSFSQTREELNYYPLHIGDVWQYKIKYFPETESDTIFYMTKKVVGDTIQSNGKRYFIVEQPPFTWKRFKTTERTYIRIDSTKGTVNKFSLKENIEQQTDSLFCKNGETFKSNYNRVFCSIGATNIFGETIKTFEVIGELSSNGGQFWKFAINIGLYRAEDYFANVTAEGNKYDLVYAKINGKEYGTYVSVEDGETIPSKFSLSQNYPNPFNPETTINFTIPNVETTRRVVFTTLKV
ncbi:MAG: 5'-nucleotidase [Stygiobacter sp.]|nr:MAG: 5'-nucleotidase [Stygiobacter sp.]